MRTEAEVVTSEQPSADRACEPRHLRVLMLSSDTYPPTRVDLTVLFGAELRSRGHVTDLILQSDSRCTNAYAAHWAGGQAWIGPTDLGTNLFSRVHKHLLSIRQDLKLFARLRTGDYRVVLVKDKFLSAVMALAAASRFKCRFVYWLSYAFPESYLQRARDGTARYPLLYWIRGTVFKLLLYRVLLPRADRIFVQSEQMRRNIAARGIPLEKMIAVPMGIQPLMFSIGGTASAERVPDGARPCIVYLGGLDRARRLDFLLRVLVQVRAAAPRATLFFVGRGDDPADETFLIEQARALGIQQAIVLTGQLARSDALEYVAAADVCVSPLPRSRVLDGASPTKLVEYMAMGKAVVATDHPDQRDLIEQSGAGYCVAYDEDAFAKAVLRVTSDPDRARDMGRRGRQYVLEHRSYAVIADIVEREMVRLAADGAH